MNSGQRTLIFWALLVVMVIAIYNMFAPRPGGQPDQYVAFGELMDAIREDPSQVKRLTVKDDLWRGRWADGGGFYTVGPRLDAALIEKLAGVPYEVQRNDGDSLKALVIGSWLPMLAPILFVAFLWQWLMARARAGQIKQLQARVTELEEQLNRGA